MQRVVMIEIEVLDVLKSGWVEDTSYYLPNTRLDRKVYVAVNEVLERIGGKWNRKAKAHLFEENPTDLIELVFLTGEMPPKNPTAFFPTPRGVAEYMLTDGAFQRIPENAQYILEPSAGKGNIAEAVRDYCYHQKISAQLECCEILPKFQERLQAQGFTVVASDFLRYTSDHPYQAIIMNPPFAVEGDALAYVSHIEHAWSLLAPGGILTSVVPAGFEFREDKRIRQLRTLVEAHGVWRALNGSAFTESGTGVKATILSVRKPKQQEVQ